MHERDNVAIVANDGGLPAGTVFAVGPDAARARAAGPQGGAGRPPEGGAVRALRRARSATRCKTIPAGSWVHERLLQMPAARALDGLPIATVKPAPQPPLEGYTFEGYRNADGSVGTRNILAITHDRAVRGRRGRLRGAAHQGRAAAASTRTSTTWSALEHSYGCGVAIDAPDAMIPIRTLRNISLNPNFGGEVMVVSLGCEKLQPERLLPPGTIPLIDERNVADVGDSADAELDVVVPAGRARTSASCR